MVSDELLALICCPDCRGDLSGTLPLRCSGCGREFARPSADYLDLRPAAAFAETTKYTNEALHADARHESVSPPLLSAAIRNDMLRAFLDLRPGDRVVDLGCGSGRALVWNRTPGATMVGVDVSPFFAKEARRDVDLALADLRRLPFRDGTFDKAWSLDVLEHLSPEALRQMLAEAARVIAPGGTLFAYSHVRRNSRLALGLRAINRLAHALDRAGLIDIARERLRKSDHLNPLADIDDLHRTVQAAGFRVARIRYYTPLIGGFVENILVRLAEQVMTRRARRRFSSPAHDRGDDHQAVRTARAEAKTRIAGRGPTWMALKALTLLMKLDILLFGRVRTGPFFVLLERTGVPAAAASPPAAGIR